MTRLILLIKSGPGTGTSIAHKGGYAKYGTPPRWHKILPNKPAPKGAPVASHPEAGGHLAPAKHFSDAEWEHLKLDAANVNAPSHNAALAKLKAHSEEGDVTAILGSGYGSNTYGVKLTKVANSLLGQHGSHHKVTPGQKAGTHAAVVHPAEPAPVPEISASTPLHPNTKATIDAGSVDFLEAVSTNNPHNPHIVAYAQKVLAQKQAAPAAPMHVFTGDGLEAYVSASTGKMAGQFGVSLKDTDAGEFVGVVNFYPTEDKAIAAAKAAAGLPAAKPGGSTFTATESAAGLAKLNELQKAPFSFDSETDTEDVFGKPAVPVMFFGPGAAHGGTIEQVNIADLIPAQDIIDPAKVASILKTGIPEDANPPEALLLDGKYYLQDGHHRVSAMALAGKKTVNVLVALSDGKDASGNQFGPKDGDTKTGADGATLVLKDGHWVLQAPTGNLHADMQKKLAAIPWYTQYLSTENSNAPSHNKAVAKICDMAMYGDVAGLKAFIASKADAKQTYAKKQVKLAALCLEALEPSDAAPAPVGPVMPEFSALPHHAAVAKKAKRYLANGDKANLYSIYSHNANSTDSSTLLLAEYGKQSLLHLGVPPAFFDVDWSQITHLMGGEKLYNAAMTGDLAAIQSVATGNFQKLKEAKAKLVAAMAGAPTNVTGAASLALQGKPAYDHLAHALGAHKMSSPHDKAVATKLAAQDWLAANPDGEPEMHAALASHGLSHQTGVIGMQTPAPAATTPLTGKAKKIASINPAEISEWLAAAPGNANGNAGFWDEVNGADKTKFHKWFGHSKNNPHGHWKNLYTATAVASLMGKHDQFLGGDGAFHPASGASQLLAVFAVTDPAKVQAAVLTKMSGAAAQTPSTPALNPSTKMILDDYAAAGEWDKVSKVANQSAPVPAKFYAQSLLAKKPAETTRVDKKDWGYTHSDQAFSGAQTLVGQSKNGEIIVLAKTDDGDYQVINTGADGSGTEDYSDFSSLADAVDLVVNHYGCPTPPLEHLKKFNAAYSPASPAPATPAPALKVKIDAPVYENKQPGHNKFWSVSTLGAVMKTNYGKIGTKGQATEKTYPSEQAAKNAAVKLMEQKKAKGYSYSGTGQHEYDGPPAGSVLSGPKDGDTKLGADGELVFKNGHWHKVRQVKKLTPSDIADAISSTSPGVTKFSNNSAGKAATIAAKAGDAAGIKSAYSNAVAYGWPNTAKKIAAVAKAMGVTVGSAATSATSASASAAKPAPAAAASSSLPGVDSIDDWKQTGQQDGYNDGAFYTDGSGQQWYCKFSAGGADVAKSEMLALQLYAAAGLATPTMKLVTKGGKVGTASKVIAGLKPEKALLQSGDAHAIFQGFAADAWLANWDTVGNNPAAGKGWDNIQFGPDGTAYRIDAGGALAHKGAGGKKSASEWGNTVVELKTLLDGSINANTAKAFGKMTDADLKASVANVIGVSDYTIQALVDQFGPGSPADKQALTLKLIARKKSIASQHADVVKKTEAKGAAAKIDKVKPDPTALKVDASLLPKAHDFMNWQGSGKPISEKPYVKQNIADEQAILDFALKGNLVALKDYKFQPVDKMTGLPTGAPAPMSQHSSAHVKSFYDDCVNFMEVLANPPAPLRTFSGAAVNTVAELSEHFSPFDYGKGVADVPANQRLGFWIALGVVADPHKFKPGIVNKAISAAKKAVAYDNWKNLPQTVKKFLSAVQGSGSANQPYRDGKETDTSGLNCRQVLTDCFAHASEHDEGFTIHKWINMGDAMIQQFLQNPEGLVFQNPGSMCTSRSATGTSGFGDHRVTIHYAKGAKGMDTFGSGSFANEQEITTIPGSRFMVLKREMVPSKGGGGKRLELEVLMLPPDPGYIANLGKTPTP